MLKISNSVLWMAMRIASGLVVFPSLVILEQQLSQGYANSRTAILCL